MPGFAEAPPRQPALVGVLLRVTYKDDRPPVEQTFTPGMADYLLARHHQHHHIATVQRLNQQGATS